MQRVIDIFLYHLQELQREIFLKLPLLVNQKTREFHSWICFNRFNFLLFKEAKSATMNIFRKKNIFFSNVKVESSYFFSINLFTIAETARKSELSYKIGVCFLLLVIIWVPPIIIDS